MESPGVPVAAAGVVRGLGLFIPLLVTAALCFWRQPNRTTWAGVLLACAWTLPSLIALHLFAARTGWWRFEVSGGVFLGIPVDLYLGWVMLWGAIPLLAFQKAPLAAVIGAMAGIDLLAMPIAHPVIVLGNDWLIGEVIGLAVCLFPAQLLGRWTAHNRRLPARATLQVGAFAGILLGLLPAAIVELTGGTWRPLLDRPPWQTGLALQVLAIPAILGLSAVQEFVGRGVGTPVPYDPPLRLVTSGPYAYLANPMQVAAVCVLCVWGVMLQSPWVAAAGLMGLAYSAGLAAWDEGGDLTDRFGTAWTRYRRGVRRWLPRWRPWHPCTHGAPAALLYVAETCVPCSQVARWFRARAPIGMTIAAAEEHPTGDLLRITYDPGDGGSVEEGVAAVGRALEHLHLGWAFLGWTIRLPPIRHFLQLVIDAAGGGPRTLARRGAAPARMTEDSSG